MNKYKIESKHILMFLIYTGIFFTLDYLNVRTNGSFTQYGLWLLIVNITLNIVMASLSTYLFHISSLNIKRTKQNFVGKNMSEMAVIFGILTYSCTPCVISFFAAFGIPFAVFTLPYAGLPYKLISLLIILIGIFLVRRESKKEVCTIESGV